MNNDEVKIAVTRAVRMTQIVGEAIREFGDQGVTGGSLYAILMGRMSYSEFNAIISVLIRAKLVRKDAHWTLRWIGPKEGE